MKRSILFITVLFILAFIPAKNQAQYTLDVNLFEGLAELQIGSIVSANGIINSQQYLHVIIGGAQGEEAQLKNEVYWQKDIESENKFVASATTQPFTVISNSMKITNLDIGSVIQIQTSEYKDEPLDEIRKLGKLAGLVTVRVRLLIDGTEVAFDEGQVGLLNPANTLDFISPPINSTWNEGNIPTQWNSITGASEYLIRCNTKQPFESLEEGLKTGLPLLWDVSVGDRVSINLWDLFQGERVPSPGSEMVLQVVAVVKSTSVDTYIESDIINFNMSNPETQQSPEQVQQFVSTMQEYIPTSNLTEQEQDDLSSFLDLVQLGQVSYNGVLDGEGNIIPAREVQRILKYLQDNPNMIIYVKKR